MELSIKHIQLLKQTASNEDKKKQIVATELAKQTLAERQNENLGDHCWVQPNQTFTILKSMKNRAQYDIVDETLQNIIHQHTDNDTNTQQRCSIMSSKT